MKLKEWNARLHGLVIFRALLDDDVIAKFVDLTDRMAAAPQSTGAVCDAAASFEAALFEHTTNFGEYLSAAVLEAETVCVRQAAVSEVPPVLQTALDNELDFLRQLCSLTLDELLDAAGAADKLPFLPRWETKAIDLHAAYAQRMSEVGKKGYGMFAKHHVFTVENGQLVPVRYPDPQRLSELPGYEQEREKVIANTRALLEGRPANNVLLYGDAGTGKSSTVKAIANEFAPDGLRLIEVKKNQLYQIPKLMEELARGICAAHGADCDFKFTLGYASVMNDKALTASSRKVIEEHFGESAVLEIDPLMPGEDFSALQENCPGFFVELGARSEEKGITFPHHNCRYLMDEDALKYGVEYLYQLVRSRLSIS